MKNFLNTFLAIFLLNSTHIVAAPWTLVMNSLESSLNKDLALLADQAGHVLDRSFSSIDFTGSIAATISLRSALKENETIVFALKDFINTASFFYKLVPKMNQSLHNVIEGACSIFFMVEDSKPPNPGQGRLVYEIHSCISNDIFAQGQESVLGMAKDSSISSEAVTVGTVNLYWDASQTAKSTKSRKKLQIEREKRDQESKKKILEILKKIL